MPRFSLICGTFGRTAEPVRMLRSLTAQTFQDFELVLIDQNPDERIVEILQSLPRPLHCERMVASPGLVRALNQGLGRAQGEIIGFPDDDCWYEPDFLERVAELLQTHPEWDGVTVPTVDETGRPSILRWDKSAGRLSKTNLGLRGCSTTVFYRRTVCQRVGPYDESIGANVPGITLVNPGFDMDYLHRVVRAGFHMEYQPQLFVRHPQTLPDGVVGEEGKRKRYYYGYGEGSIVRKYSVPLWYVGALMVFPFMRAIRQRLTGHSALATKEWLTFRGRLDGWLKTPSLK